MLASKNMAQKLQKIQNPLATLDAWLTRRNPRWRSEQTDSQAPVVLVLVRHGSAAVSKHTLGFDFASCQCDSFADGILQKGVLEIFRQEMCRDSKTLLFGPKSS